MAGVGDGAAGDLSAVKDAHACGAGGEPVHGVEVALARGRGDEGVGGDAEGVPGCAVLAV